jgi:hypothetical protein
MEEASDENFTRITPKSHDDDDDDDEHEHEHEHEQGHHEYGYKRFSRR